MRGSRASGVQQLIRARADRHRGQLDGHAFEHEVGAVALAEREKDAAPAGRLEAHGTHLDDVGPADLHVLHEVASRGVGHDLPASAARRQGRPDNGAVDRRPVILDDASLKRSECDALRAEWTRGQTQRDHPDGEQAKLWDHPLGRSNSRNRG